MNKKIILAVILILTIIGGTSYLSYKNYFLKQPQIQVTRQQTGKTNNFENAKLAQLAENYVLGKPKLLVDGGMSADWNTIQGLVNSSPEWIISHKPTIEYIPAGKYKAPYDYLNDKYTVYWLFIPGCEEDFNSKNIPNWSKNGLPCIGGYILRVLINSDGEINRVELNTLKG